MELKNNSNKYISIIDTNEIRNWQDILKLYYDTFIKLL